jgi:hypothetical protein
MRSSSWSRSGRALTCEYCNIHKPSNVGLQTGNSGSPVAGWLQPTEALYEIPLRLVKSFPSAQWLTALRRDLHR